MDSLEVRIIGDDEIEIVKKVSEGVFTYDGKTNQDYFPCYFTRWANSSNHYIYGLYANNNLVAISCDSLFDNGRTIFAQALRVSNQHRNKGYVAELNKRVKTIRDELVLNRYPVERMRVAIADHQGNVAKKLEERKKLFPEETVLGVRSLVTGTFTNTDLKDKLSNLSSNSSIIAISHEIAFEFAKNHPKLFPHNSIYTDWEAYDLTYENFIIMATGGLGTFVNLNSFFLF